MPVQTILIADDGTLPGSRFPALLYKAALDIPVLFPAAYLSDVFKAHGWRNSWDAGIFTEHHYHSTTHEVLGIYRGSAMLQLGGAAGRRFLVEKGDVLVIAARVAHKNLDREDAVGVVGAYPDGRDYDMNYGKPGERPRTDKNIAQVPLPGDDPLGLPDGLINNWKK